MRIARATFVALTAFLAGAVALEVVAMFVFVGYGRTSVGAALLYSALPVVILATTFAVLQAQRSLSNADWRQAVMTVPRGRAATATGGELTDDLGRLPASHWGIPEPSPEEEQLAGMQAQLPYWSSEPVQAWTGPAVAASSEASLPKRRAGVALEEATAAEPAEQSGRTETVTTLVLPGAGDEEALAAAVAEALRQVKPSNWAPISGPAVG